MQVWASVNEANIGRIRPGVKVRFTVDTYPNETFLGEVSQVRLNASMTQNVVTYTVVVTTENKDKRLLPYMTANMQFEIARHENVLKVPNASLRWKPRKEQIDPDVRDTAWAEMNRRGDKSKDSRPARGEGRPGKEFPRDSAAAPQTTGGTAAGVAPDDWKARADSHARQQGKPSAAAPQNRPEAVEHGPPGKPVSLPEAATGKEPLESGRLWVVDGGFVRPVAVTIVATDGTMTEVRGTELQEDLEVVIGENVASSGDDTTNPFMPKFPRGGGRMR
jgi:HlyD family secretion protein